MEDTLRSFCGHHTLDSSEPLGNIGLRAFSLLSRDMLLSYRTLGDVMIPKVNFNLTPQKHRTVMIRSNGLDTSRGVMEKSA